MAIPDSQSPVETVYLIKIRPKMRDIEGPSSHQRFCRTTLKGIERAWLEQKKQDSLASANVAVSN